jgi:uncharacterized membrane protein
VCLAIGLGSAAFGDIVTLDFPGAAETQATGVNALGQIVGVYQNPCFPFPAGCSGGSFLYSNGAFSVINGSFWAGGINDNGQIVGSAGNSAVLDNNGALSILSIPGAMSVQAAGINNAGDIVGVYTTGSPGATYNHAFIYSGGIVSTITPLDSFASGINDQGQIVGSLTSQGAFLYSGGAFYPISVPGSTSTAATGINDAGEIVGFYYDQSGFHGFTDINGAYSTIDVPGAGATFAEGVNNSGQVVGYYVEGGSLHGFLDTPVPEPSSIILLASATGLLAFARLRRKRRAA